MFHAISFGRIYGSDQYWNHHTFHSTQLAAERWALDQMPIAGTFGYVVIRESDNSWEVVDEIGAVNVSISPAPIGGFSVQPSPRLVLV